MKQREEFWRSELDVEAPDRKPWVALVDGRVVGFASAGLSRDEDAGPEAGEVYHVYVDPECWGRGIGHNLLGHVLRDLRRHGFANATFWIMAQDDAARGWAAKQGWALDGGTRLEDWSGIKMEQVRYVTGLR